MQPTIEKLAGAVKANSDSKEVAALPRKRSKEQMKEELRSQKVMEKRLALRRRRTRNRRYMSEEFTSIFTEKNQSFSSLSYQEVGESPPHCSPAAIADPPISNETVEIDTSISQTVEVDDSFPKSPPTPTQDEHDPDIYAATASEVLVSEQTSIPIYEMDTSTAYTAALTLGQLENAQSKDSNDKKGEKANSINSDEEIHASYTGVRCTSPYSDISESSKEDLIDPLPKEKKPTRKKMEEKPSKSEKSTRNLPAEPYTRRRSSHSHYDHEPVER